MNHLTEKRSESVKWSNFLGAIVKVLFDPSKKVYYLQYRNNTPMSFARGGIDSSYDKRRFLIHFRKLRYDGYKNIKKEMAADQAYSQACEENAEKDLVDQTTKDLETYAVKNRHTVA